MEDKIIEIIAEQFCIDDKEKITLESNIEKDLKGDSLDKIELLLKLEDELGIIITTDEELHLDTVGDIIKLVKENKGEN